MGEQRPTETDRLLPHPFSPPDIVASSRNVIRDDDGACNPVAGAVRRRRRLVAYVIGVVAVIVGFTVALGVAYDGRGDGRGGGRRDGGDDVDEYDLPDAQRHELQMFTENALLSILPNDTLARIYRQGADIAYHHPTGKIHEVTKSSGHRHDDIDDRSDVFRCTSQVMIMRHCDKEVSTRVGGHEVTTDAHDSRGNRHCSATGKARSEYIATLFVDPDDYEELVAGGGKDDHRHHAGKKSTRRDDDAYVPSVPMVKSTLSRVSKVASSRKPQFPTPLKLYALAPERDGGGRHGKVHENYREVETITPLSRKFRLDVDDRYGVGDEGELAKDYFADLGGSVTEKYRVRMIGMAGNNVKTKRGDDADGDGGRSGMEGEALCDRGMTVVNWKHSRIPELARALGCGIEQGCPKKYDSKDFDTMWLLTFQYSLVLGGMGDSSSSSSSGREKGGVIDDGPESPVSSLLAAFFESKSSSSGGARRRGGGGGRALFRAGESGDGGRRNNNIGTWKIKAEMVNEGFYPV
jgi:hypothetical protein